MGQKVVREPVTMKCKLASRMGYQHQNLVKTSYAKQGASFSSAYKPMPLTKGAAREPRKCPGPSARGRGSTKLGHGPQMHTYKCQSGAIFPLISFFLKFEFMII